MEDNPVQLNGVEFLEFSGPNTEALQKMLLALGFKHVASHKKNPIDLYRQGDISTVINRDPNSFANEFSKEHGPSACATGFISNNSQLSYEVSISRGAKAYKGEGKTFNVPAVYGIGDSLIYFVEDVETLYSEFDWISSDRKPASFGLKYIDHFTNNVPFGEMQKWCDFYEDVFNFKENRYFDIKGTKTGLYSKVMRSPCGKITVPINEPDQEKSKSQIQEYLDEYKGSGIQHIALYTDNILEAVSSLRSQGVDFLDTPDTYYEMIDSRVPNVTEDYNTLKNLKVLVDGDEEGYLLQIFTKNMCGPIFFEIIQRKGHDGFGEGNFQALFEAIERDQEKRGVL